MKFLIVFITLTLLVTSSIQSDDTTSSSTTEETDSTEGSDETTTEEDGSDETTTEEDESSEGSSSTTKHGHMSINVGLSDGDGFEYSTSGNFPLFSWFGKLIPSWSWPKWK